MSNFGRGAPPAGPDASPATAAEAGNTVRGERAATLVYAVRGVQSRVSNLLAAGLMIALGVAALTWYYAHALARPTHTRQSAQANAANRAAGEMPLPPLGPIALPAATVLAQPAQPAIESPAPVSPDLPLAEAPPAPLGTSQPGPSTRTPAELELQRRLSGVVFARESGPTAPASPSADAAESVQDTAQVAADTGVSSRTGATQAASDGRGESLAGLLRPTVTDSVQARMLPTQRFLLPKGSFIDCTLETAIDSTLPGMTTCVTATDTFGADGKVVLLERGTKLVGETRGEVQQGQARVFVLWTQARTPAGVVVPLDSPGTDELGRSGLPGEVQRHFWQRFGAAMLVSLVDGVVQAGVQASTRSNGAVIYAPSASQDVLTEVLRGTISIPPTVIKRNGDRIEVLVARDLDFRSVYELRSRGGTP
jgi:type IV secretion system protein VirB10